jgi:hypothetical protein
MLLSEIDTRTLKGKVNYILDQEPGTRNSDDELYRKVIFQFYREYFKKDSDGYGYIRFSDKKHIPSQQSIIRWRAYFQNKVIKYQPSEVMVKINRRSHSKKWLKDLGY